MANDSMSTCARSRSRDAGGQAHVRGEVAHQHHDACAKDQTHRNASQDALHQEKLPPLGTETGGENRQD